MPTISSNIALIKTQEYFNKIASIDSSTKDRKSVFEFIEGIYDLGLWNNIVCYPMRTRHTLSGTNTSVFSLGGYGQYDSAISGTVDGSTRQDGGIYFNGTDNVISPTLLTGSITESYFGIFTSANYSHYVSNPAAQGATFGSRPGFGVTSGPEHDTKKGITILTDGTTPILRVVNGDGTLDEQREDHVDSTPNMVVSSIANGTKYTIRYNNTTYQTATVSNIITPTYINSYIGSEDGTQYKFIGNISFVMYIFGIVANDVNLYNLYKGTIGKDLSLP